MKTSATTRRLFFTLGLLAASVTSVTNSAEPKVGDIIENSVNMKLAYIPPGEFDMGSPESEKERQKNELLHHVKLTRGFYLGVYEVTQFQFEKVLGRNPALFSIKNGGAPAGKETASFPVEQVSWFDAVEFCNALSKSEELPEYYTLQEVNRKDGAIANAKVTENGGLGYRLPTEAEWEYACRASTKTPFHFGDVLNGKDANVSGKTPYGTLTAGPSLGRTREVGGYASNKFGLYDMHGNVSEWCNDWYGDYADDGVDPKGSASGDRRSCRGGAVYNFARDARSARRLTFRPSGRNNTTGFRAARTSSGKEAEPKVVAPAEPKAGDIIENSIKMKLAYIPPGEFDMGSPESEKERLGFEKLHHVKLTKGFYLGVYEVTQSQFEEVLGRNPSYYSKDGYHKIAVAGKVTARFPVEYVDWFDAIEFCNALSKSEKLPEYYTLLEVNREGGRITRALVTENGSKGYRLPTEAEWEYACRAGTKTPFHFGDVLNGKDANVNGEFPYGTATKGPNLGRPCTVGSYPANAFGLYDMHGNVFEWCNDWDEEYTGDGVDPQGPDSGAARVLRGGSFGYFALLARSAIRGGNIPTHRASSYGFRAARTGP